MAGETVHATCLLRGEAGILIRGRSGSGKSSLARRLLAEGGPFTRLVADDRVRLTACHGRLIARPVPPLEGLMELRGVGLRRIVHEGAAIVRIVVDITEAAQPRLPEDAEGETTLLGVVLPRLRGPSAAELANVIRFMTPGTIQLP